MSRMFSSCSGLTSLDLSNFDISNVTNYTDMFRSVPTTVQIKTNQATKDWINTNFSGYTNIITP